MKSPITIVTTKIDPMAIPDFDSGSTTVTIVAHHPAPLSSAASSSLRSIRIMVLKIGVTMNSV